MVESKQVKVDNWGIFFLQRLQQFYNKSSFCDLILQFEDNVQIKVHRLVMNACTEYFQALEQTCLVKKDCIMMPSNLPSDVVIPIINFMYSGILEFHESLFDRLYSTAILMNMSVLTKLLDAQKVPIKPLPKRVQSVTPITWNLQGKRITARTYAESELPETLPGRKLPIWKRKTIPSIPFLTSNNFENYLPKVKSAPEEPPKPTRFEWPEEDSTFENTFDDISYESKPVIMPALSPEKSPKPSTSSTFEEIKRSALPVKRSASPIGNQCKRVNIQDVKDYVKEHKIRSDFIDYDDAEMADNDLQTFDNDDSNEETGEVLTLNPEDTPSKSILKNDGGATHSNKHVRFSLDGKENVEKKLQQTPTKTVVKTSPGTPKPDQNTPEMSKHTKIITEVLKKYPHLVKNNKNIRLKILQKGPSTPNAKTISKTSIPVKQPSKISYKVVKPEQAPKAPITDKEQTWECTNCKEPQTFTSYLTYRQHLIETHNGKQDSQMCNICGHVSRKQNMLVYHKFVKHNITPPAMYNFPKCKDCNYVALSPIILQKHIDSHSHTNTCLECNMAFANKLSLISHLQQTGHSQDRLTPQWGCSYCDKRFFSENILKTHIKRSHEEEFNTDTKTLELGIKKEKIKILSDVKVTPGIVNQTYQVKTSENEVIKAEIQPEPSSEAEALSNVASGIAASLGLVDTIVVLDENQYILQSQHQQNMLNTSEEYILPAMDIPTSTINELNQHQTVTLTDSNNVLTQSFKSGITSTDELVMVLTDHAYTDAANNDVMSDNNIVVLYSHPVQTQSGTVMLSETSMIEVEKNYPESIPITLDQQTPCEESIEMIQQEINNQLDTNVPETECQYEDAEIKEIDTSPEREITDIENTEIIIMESSETTNINQIDVCVQQKNEMETQMVQIHEEKPTENIVNDNTEVQVIPEENNPTHGDEAQIEEAQIQKTIEEESSQNEEVQIQTILQEESSQNEEVQIQTILQEENSQNEEVQIQKTIQEEETLSQENNDTEQTEDVKMQELYETNTQETQIDPVYHQPPNEIENNMQMEDMENVEPDEIIDLTDQTPIIEDTAKEQHTSIEDTVNEEDTSIDDVSNKDVSIVQTEENFNSQEEERQSEVNTQSQIEEMPDHIEDNMSNDFIVEASDKEESNLESTTEIATLQESEIAEIPSESISVDDIIAIDPNNTEKTDEIKETIEVVEDNVSYNEAPMEIPENIAESKQEESLNDSVTIDMSADETGNQSDESDIILRVDDIHFTPNKTVENLSDGQNKNEVISIQKENEPIEGENDVEKINDEEKLSEIKSKNENNGSQLVLRNERISKLLDDWDDGDTDSSNPQESENSSITKLIDDWDDEEDS